MPAVTPRRSTSSHNTPASSKTPTTKNAATLKSSMTTTAAAPAPSSTATSSSKKKVDTGAVKQFSNNFNSQSSLAKLEAQLNKLEGKVEEEEDHHHERDPSSSVERDSIVLVNENEQQQQQQQEVEQPAITTKKVYMFSSNPQNGISSSAAPSPAPPSSQQQRGPAPPPSSSRVGGRASTANDKTSSIPPTTGSVSARMVNTGTPTLPGGSTTRFIRSSHRAAAAAVGGNNNNPIMRAANKTDKLLMDAQEKIASAKQKSGVSASSPRSSSKTTTSARSTSSKTNTATRKKEEQDDQEQVSVISEQHQQQVTPSKIPQQNEEEQRTPLPTTSPSSSPEDKLARYDKLARSVQRRASNQNQIHSSPSSVARTTITNNKTNENNGAQQFTTEDAYPWADSISPSEARIMDCKLKGAMEKHGTGSFIYTFPKTGFFACKRCHKKIASASSKFAAEGGYASFEKYCVPNLKCDLLLCSGSSASSTKELNELKRKHPNEIFFINDATVAVSCSGCLANIGVLHPIHAHLMVSSGCIVHCSVDSFLDQRPEDIPEEDTIFVEALASRGGAKSRPGSRLSNRPASRMSVLKTGDDDDNDNVVKGSNNQEEDDDEEEEEEEEEYPEATANSVLFL